MLTSSNDRPRWAACGLGLSILSVAGFALAQPVFPPTGPDVLQTPTLTMIDPEFNHDKRMLVWVDTVTGNIWQASYDLVTGSFIPANGRGVLIEAAVSTGGEYPGLGFTVNGPEWAIGTPTDYIVYTRNNVRGDPTPANALIGVAYQEPGGAWTRTTLSGPRRNGPYGSLGRNATAKISYQDSTGAQYVRSIGDPASETLLPGFARTSLAPPTARFVEDANLVVYQAKVNGMAQSVAFNIDTKVLTQLTFDAKPKDQSWMWKAPEFDGALALMATVDESTVTMYAPDVGPDGSTSYRAHGTAVAPQRGKWYSVEPFVHLGRSYMIAQLTPRGSTYPTSIWLAGFDPANPILRQLTPNGASTEARADAEVVPIASGVMITYSKFDTTKCTPANTSTWLCMQALMGLFRADTGLPPPQ